MAEISRFVPDDGAIRRLTDAPSGVVAQAILRKAREVESVAKQLCPVDQGGLRNSIHVEPITLGGHFVAVIGSGLNYALYVHEGTGIYGRTGRPIVPVRAKVLRWQQRGSSPGGRSRRLTGPYVFSRSSKGSPPRPFLRRALEAVMGRG